MTVRTPWEGAPRPPRRWQLEAIPKIRQAFGRGERGVVHAIMGSGKSVCLAEICWLAAGALPPAACIVVSTPSVALVEQLADTVAKRCGADQVGTFYTHSKEATAPIIVACNASLPNLVFTLRLAERTCYLLVADECHKTETDEVIKAVGLLEPKFCVGFTATPFRSSVKQTLSLFDSLIVSYALGDALRDGVLVPWTTILWDGQLDAGDDEGDTPVGEVDAVCLDMIRRHAPPGPGIVSARSIRDAERFAELLVANGIPARPIHSKLSREDRATLLELLHSGELRCLVHVALLAEGVDMPWLRWLCLRRKVKARVRFMQEVGRVLRSEAPEDCPPGIEGKTAAVILDPHDLFERHGLSHQAALGEKPAAPDEEDPEAVEEEVKEPPTEEDEFDLIDLEEDSNGQIPVAVAVDAVGAWARRLLAILDLAGLWKKDPRWSRANAPWREEAISAKQAAHLAKMSWTKKYFPPPYRDSLQAVLRSPGTLRKGIASDLGDAIHAIADAGRAGTWKWPEVGLDLPVLPRSVISSLCPPLAPVRDDGEPVAVR